MTSPKTALKAASLLALLASPQTSFADDTHTPATPEAHAPIGVMGDHMHKAGDYMVSLRQMNMRMKGNIHGRDNVSDEQVRDIANQHGTPMMLPNLRVVPQEMSMDMTMLGAMYAPSNHITLVAMVMQIENEMTLNTYNAMSENFAGSFTSTSSGMGDTTLGVLLRGGETANGKWHYGLALSLPTGSITETGRVLLPTSTTETKNYATKRLPYPMQLGSGSYDFKPSLTYNGDWGGWRVGAQAAAIMRLNDNDEDYRLGDKAELQGWAMKNLSPIASASLRLNVTHQGKIDGQDAKITLPVQTAQTDFSGGTFANLSVGLNLIGQSGALRDHRLALEYVMPVHQDAHGVQMKRDETLSLGWQKAF